MREFRSFLIAPLPAAFLAGIISAMTGSFPRPVSIFVFFCLLLYLMQLLLGVAIRALLIRKRHLSAVSFAVGGFVMTALPTAPYAIFAATKHSFPWWYASLFFSLLAFYGALTGVTYWLGARPDRRALS
jgi:hypothetical protein